MKELAEHKKLPDNRRNNRPAHPATRRPGDESQERRYPKQCGADQSAQPGGGRAARLRAFAAADFATAFAEFDKSNKLRDEFKARPVQQAGERDKAEEIARNNVNGGRNPGCPAGDLRGGPAPLRQSRRSPQAVRGASQSCGAGGIDGAGLPAAQADRES